MEKIYFLFFVIFVQINSQIKENPIFLTNNAKPFILSTNDSDFYYVITEGESLKMNKESGIINMTKNYPIDTSNSYFFIVDKAYNNYIYYKNNYYKIKYETFISVEQIEFSKKLNDGGPINILPIGSISKDNDFIIYGH